MSHDMSASRASGELALRRVAVAVLSAVGAAGVLASAGCAQQANAVEGAEPVPRLAAAAEVPAVRASEPSVTVTNPGAEPRQVLQLTPTVGTVQRLVVSQSGWQQFELDGETDDNSYPPLDLAVRLEVTAKDDDTGSSTVAVDIERADAGAIGDEVVDSYSRSLVSGFGGSTTITVRSTGAVPGSEPVIGIDDETTVLALGHVERNFLTLADPLPTEPVGVGAVWEVRFQGQSSGLNATFVNTYTVTSITDTEVLASVVRGVYYPAGEQAEAEIGTGSRLTGQGTAQWNRAAIVGTASYQVSGTIHHRITTLHELHQQIHRAVTSETTDLTIPPPPDPPADDPPADDPDADDPPADDPDADDPPADDPGADDPGAGDGAGAGDAGEPGGGG